MISVGCLVFLSYRLSLHRLHRRKKTLVLCGRPAHKKKPPPTPRGHSSSSSHGSSDPALPVPDSITSYQHTVGTAPICTCIYFAMYQVLLSIGFVTTENACLLVYRSCGESGRTLVLTAVLWMMWSMSPRVFPSDYCCCCCCCATECIERTHTHTEHC